MLKWLKRLACKHLRVRRKISSRIQDGSGTAHFTCRDCGKEWDDFVFNARE